MPIGTRWTAAAMLSALVTWMMLALCYLLFAGQVSRNEMIAGAGASLAAAAYTGVAHFSTDCPMDLRLRWDRIIAGVAKSLVLDTIRVGSGLLRGATGVTSHAALPVDDRLPSGERAVAILALSVAPNGYVVHALGKQALLHQLVPTDLRQQKK